MVVTSGAYLLQSEYLFRKGASPRKGMDMGGMKMQEIFLCLILKIKINKKRNKNV
jgi:hypothetical protein